MADDSPHAENENIVMGLIQGSFWSGLDYNDQLIVANAILSEAYHAPMQEGFLYV